MDFISNPLGQLLYLIYKYVSFDSYGLSIIIFTILIKAVLLPLTIKQQKSSVQMQKMQPLLKEVQDRYKNDKEKLSQETARIYKESGSNPLSGCLPSLLQLPILFALYGVITNPLKYMFGFTVDRLTQLSQFMVDNGMVLTGTLKKFSDINIIDYFSKNLDKLDSVKDLIARNNILNLNFLGLNLGFQPTYNPATLFGPDKWIYLPLFLIPVLAAVTTYFSIKFATPKTVTPAATTALKTTTPKPGEKKPADPAAMTGMMTKIMPLVTLFFAFSVPAGLGLYWIISSLVQIIQQYFINKHVLKKMHDAPTPIKALTTK